MSFESTCPACGSPVTFDVTASVVTVCQACNSVVGRGDGKLEEYGKVADLVQTDSPLKVGLRGKYKGVPFEVTGRTQYRHSAGGVWDEWYVAFRGGQKWGWLAEAQGKVYLTFAKDVPDRKQLPALDDLEIEDVLTIPGEGAMKVVEVGQGIVTSAEGEIPFKVTPGEEVRFADLEGSGRKFASLDATNGALALYCGGQVTFDQLGIAESVRDREKEERRVGAVQVNCTSCGGMLELQAPDESLRVGCPYCGSLHDVNHGNLRFLKTLQKKAEPMIPLGTVGKLPGHYLGYSDEVTLEFKVIGFMQRKVVYGGTSWYWQEYLLYQPRQPFCWLIHSEGHWSFGRPVSAGEVSGGLFGTRYEGKRFRIFERSKPVVDYVIGEFYWKVNVGERVDAADYVHPPYMLSREAALGEQKQQRGKKNRRLTPESEDVAEAIEQAFETEEQVREVNYTLSRYVPTEEIEEAFGVQNLPRGSSVAPNQPYPHKGVYKAFAGLLAVALLVALVVFSTASRRKLVNRTFVLKPNQTSVFFEEPVKVRGGRNVKVNVSSRRWVYVRGYFYNDDKQRIVEEFGVPTGETVYLSALPEGDYTLKLKSTWKNSTRSSSPSFKVDVREGVPHASHLVLLLVGLAVLPIGVGIHHMSFEANRWKESDFNPFATE